MSIFTYHLIEALTGHAQPQGGATEVLVSDVLGYVYRQVPAAAREQWSQEQQPDGRMTGNFAVSLLLGGKGLAKGDVAPDPLADLEAAPQARTGGGTYIHVSGSGAAATGGGVAAGKGGVAVKGNVSGGIRLGGHSRDDDENERSMAMSQPTRRGGAWKPSWPQCSARMAALQQQLTAVQSGSGGLAAHGGVAAGRQGVAVGKNMMDSWIVTGDNNVLNCIVQHYRDQGGESDEETLRRQIVEYLRWVVDRYGTIELRGIKREGQQVVRLDLDTVYVPLEAVTPGAGSRTIPLNQVLSVGERLVITGGPGCGKTTVLQHIAWTLAQAIGTSSRQLAQDKLGLTTGAERSQAQASEEQASEAQIWFRCLSCCP